jgi:choline dehydrogenase
VAVAVAATPTPGIPHDPQVTNPLGIRYTASGSDEFNDMQMYIFTIFDKSVIAGAPSELPCPIIAVLPVLQRPRARGRVTLRNADPNVPAVIDLNFVGHSEDMRRMVDGVRIAWRLMNSVRFAPYVKDFMNATHEIVDSDSSAADFIRDNCDTIFHPVGTAKMGPDSDKEAVVDQYCRVRGVEGLRVVDASVMPNIVRANTNLTCIMIGERVADWMREEA